MKVCSGKSRQLLLANWHPLTQLGTHREPGPWLSSALGPGPWALGPGPWAGLNEVMLSHAELVFAELHRQARTNEYLDLAPHRPVRVYIPS